MNYALFKNNMSIIEYQSLEMTYLYFFLCVSLLKYCGLEFQGLSYLETIVHEAEATNCVQWHGSKSIYSCYILPGCPIYLACHPLFLCALLLAWEICQWARHWVFQMTFYGDFRSKSLFCGPIVHCRGRRLCLGSVLCLMHRGYLRCCKVLDLHVEYYQLSNDVNLLQDISNFSAHKLTKWGASFVSWLS